MMGCTYNSQKKKEIILKNSIILSKLKKGKNQKNNGSSRWRNCIAGL
jgi:hypothetical protein